MQEINNDPFWQVIIEMKKNDGYYYKGQEIDEIIQALSKEEALEKLLKNNSISKENVIEKGIREWTM